MAQYIYGINPVLHSIDSKKIKKIYISDSFSNNRVLNIVKSSSIPYEIVRKERILSLFKNVKNTQGIAAEVEDYKTYSLEEVLSSTSKKEKSIIIVLDNLEDPHNLGAILRIADVFNVDAIIYKKNNQVGLNEVVAKVSTGAINYIKCVCVSNLVNAIKVLKDNGYWIYASDMESTNDYNKVDYANKSVLIVGSEGFGISQLVLKNSDFIIKIPMHGHVNSLNASNATAIIVSEMYSKIY